MSKLINIGLKLIGAWKWYAIVGLVIAGLVAANVVQYRSGQALELRLQSCKDEQKDLMIELEMAINLTSSQTRLGGQALTATERKCLDETQAAYDAGRNSALPDGVRKSAAELQRDSAWTRSVPAERER